MRPFASVVTGEEPPHAPAWDAKGLSGRAAIGQWLSSWRPTKPRRCPKPRALSCNLFGRRSSRVSSEEVPDGVEELSGDLGPQQGHTWMDTMRRRESSTPEPAWKKYNLHYFGHPSEDDVFVRTSGLWTAEAAAVCLPKQSEGPSSSSPASSSSSPSSPASSAPKMSPALSTEDNSSESASGSDCSEESSGAPDSDSGGEGPTSTGASSAPSSAPSKVTAAPGGPSGQLEVEAKEPEGSDDA